MTVQKIPQETWDKVKYEYTVSSLSQREIAKKFGISISTINKRCQSDEWTKSRREYRHKILAAAVDKTAGEQGNKLAKLMAASDKLDEMIAHVCALSDNTELSIRDLRDITATIRDAIAIKRDLWNIPKEHTEETEMIIRIEKNTEEFAK